MVVLVFDAALVVAMEAGDRAADPLVNATQAPNTTPSPTPTVTTVSTPPPTTVYACGLVLVNITTDKPTYCYQNDSSIFGQLLVRNPLVDTVNTTSLVLLVVQTKTSGAGAPNVQHLLWTEATLGNHSIGPGNTTYLNFRFINPLFESTIGTYVLDADLMVNGIACGMTVSTTYEVTGC